MNTFTSKPSILHQEGYTYGFDPSACAACGGACCTGESGYIWAKYEEIEQMAAFLELSVEDFGKMYLRKVRHRYSLTEKQIGEENYACVFFDTTQLRCTIYPVRPRQCRTFPFWESYKQNEDEVRDECPGII